jgi:hypothetical protein
VDVLLPKKLVKSTCLGGGLTTTLLGVFCDGDCEIGEGETSFFGGG